MPISRSHPSPEELRAATSTTVPDLLAPNLRVLFCGINPGLYSAAVGHHFARPGNRFWPVLYAGGFTPQVFSPAEERRLLDLGLGITNVVERSSAAAAELSKAELQSGAKVLQEKVLRHVPKVLAVLGVGAYWAGFNRPQAILGLQKETLGHTYLWILPNPSGLNAHYQPKDLGRLFADLHRFVT